MEVGAIVHVVLPVGVQDNCTVPLNRPEGVSVTVKVAGVPLVTGTDVADAVKVKSAPVELPEPLTLPAPLPVPVN
jgi:hypothetical protein